MTRRQHLQNVVGRLLVDAVVSEVHAVIPQRPAALVKLHRREPDTLIS